MWYCFEKGEFSPKGLTERYQSARHLLLWQKSGWSEEDLIRAKAAGLLFEDLRIGSKTFFYLWSHSQNLSEKARLELLLNLIDMPLELSGELTENRFLISQFHPNLAPDDRFWKEIAELVSRNFPGESLADTGNLEKRLHQFRYVISSQQAEYVRRHYKEAKMTDAQALALYLKGKRFTLFDLGRLHNKLAFEQGTACFPDGLATWNIKILLAFRTEFILDSQGNFLNELDVQRVSEAGIVNGASFNYGKWRRHYQLDVLPVGPHDPMFRRRIAKRFKAAGSQRQLFFRKNQRSFYAKKGDYSWQGQSMARKVKRARWQFLKLFFCKLP